MSSNTGIHRYNLGTELGPTRIYVIEGIKSNPKLGFCDRCSGDLIFVKDSLFESLNEDINYLNAIQQEISCLVIDERSQIPKGKTIRRYTNDDVKKCIKFLQIVTISTMLHFLNTQVFNTQSQYSGSSGSYFSCKWKYEGGELVSSSLDDGSGRQCWYYSIEKKEEKVLRRFLKTLQELDYAEEVTNQSKELRRLSRSNYTLVVNRIQKLFIHGQIDPYAKIAIRRSVNKICGILSAKAKR